MSTTLTLEIPSGIYQYLKKRADRRGGTLEQILIEWLGRLVKDEPDDDPLLRFAGAFSSDVPDIGENHDFYIGRELNNTHE